MDLFRKLTSRKSKNPLSRSRDVSIADEMSAGASNQKNLSSFHDDAPPVYTVQPSSAQAQAQADSPYAFLAQFDTVFLIDDSGSMAGRNWRETAAALSAITSICTEQDTNGIDIYFLNHRNPYANDRLGAHTHVTTTASVQEIFTTVQPRGGTPTGTRLNQILKEYVEEFDKKQKHGRESSVKPLNIIVITDGVATDDVESAIVSAAKKLDKLNAEPWQVGVQFFQVGQEPAAAADLRELDDALADTHGVRDMVDTVPWSSIDGAVLTAEGIMKVTMGAINRKLDRKKIGESSRHR